MEKKPKIKLIENLQKGEMIPLIHDSTAKKFFSRKTNKKILEFLIANILNLENVKVTAYLPLSEPDEMLITKDMETDLLVTINKEINLIIEFNHFKKDILKLFKKLDLDKELEIKLNGDHQTKRNRNLKYLSEIFSRGELKEGDKYEDLMPVYLININTFASKTNSKQIFYSYKMSDEKDFNNTYSDLIKIFELDVAMCYKSWYNNSYKGKDIKNSNLILIGAMMVTNKISEFNKIVKELNLDLDVKEKMRRSVLKMCQNDLLLRAYYNPKELAEELERESLALYRAQTRKEGLQEGILKGREENQKMMIINSFKKNIPATTIAEICGVSLDKVNEVINSYKKSS